MSTTEMVMSVPAMTMMDNSTRTSSSSNSSIQEDNKNSNKTTMMGRKMKKNHDHGRPRSISSLYDEKMLSKPNFGKKCEDMDRIVSCPKHKKHLQRFLINRSNGILVNFVEMIDCFEKEKDNVKRYQQGETLVELYIHEFAPYQLHVSDSVRDALMSIYYQNPQRLKEHGIFQDAYAEVYRIIILSNAFDQYVNKQYNRSSRKRRSSMTSVLKNFFSFVTLHHKS